MENCSFCATHSRQQRAEPLRPSQLPERPWAKIGVDLCFKDGLDYLIVVDYFSRWIEVIHLSETTSSYVIGKLKNLFSKFGIPEIVVSDQGPQFNSASFCQFGIEYGFQHYKSDPHFPQENGCAERAVQTAKRILSQEDVFLALMTYRATPLDTTGYSPAQLLMGRQIRTRVPMIKSKLLPNWPALEKVAENDAKMKSASAASFDRHHRARPLPQIGQDTPILLKQAEGNKWEEKATVIGSQIGNRSYLIRNRRHVRALPFEVGNKIVQSGVQKEIIREQGPSGSAGARVLPSGDIMHGNLKNPTSGNAEYGNGGQSPRISQGTVTKSGRQSKPPAQLDL